MSSGEAAVGSLAVVGAGWAGLAASVRAAQAGAAVSLFEMAPGAGGRARTVVQHGRPRDNGQHILIGAYGRTLDLMRTVDVDPAQVLARHPLALVDARNRGLRLPAGAPLAAFTRGVLAHPDWTLRERLAVLRHAASWWLGGFAVETDLPVSAWCATLPRAVHRQLIEPLCVAALNTEAAQASAAVFLRVLHDALFAGRGSADLLLPRRPLGELLPDPAAAWLQRQGAGVHFGRRVHRLEPREGGWSVDGQPFERVVLACSAREAARLAQPIDAAWAAQVASFAYEPIVTAWLEAPRVRAPFPMTSLSGSPAQFAFDLGSLDPQRSGWVTLVVSAAARWLEAGPDALDSALRQQVDRELAGMLPDGYRVAHTAVEKRATFRCTPSLARPRQLVVPGLAAAGDYVEGPYPATLEGAVRSGEAAVAALLPAAR